MDVGEVRVARHSEGTVVVVAGVGIGAQMPLEGHSLSGRGSQSVDGRTTQRKRGRA